MVARGKCELQPGGTLVTALGHKGVSVFKWGRPALSLEGADHADPARPTAAHLLGLAFGSDCSWKQLDKPLVAKTRLPKTVIRQPGIHTTTDPTTCHSIRLTCSQRCAHNAAHQFTRLYQQQRTPFFCVDCPIQWLRGDLISPYPRVAALIETAPPILRLVVSMDYDDCAEL